MHMFKVTRVEPHAQLAVRANGYKQAAQRSGLAVPRTELLVEGAHKHVRFLVTLAGGLMRRAVYEY